MTNIPLLLAALAFAFSLGITATLGALIFMDKRVMAHPSKRVEAARRILTEAAPPAVHPWDQWCTEHPVYLAPDDDDDDLAHNTDKWGAS